MVATVRNLADGGASMTTRRPVRRVVGRRFLRETAAGSIVEFAIVVPVLIFLLLGMIDFALAFNTRLNIVSVTRDLARSLAVQADPCNASVQNALRFRADTLFVRMNRSDPLLSGYVTPIVTCPAASVTVAINGYPMRSTFLRLGPFSLSARSVFRWERAN